MAARQWMSRALWMVGLASVATGCVDDGVSLHVVCPAVPTVDEDSCTWDATGDTCTVEGVLNLSSAPVYRLNLRVESGLKPRARDVPPLSEPNGMQMTYGEVEIRTTSGSIIVFNGLPNPFESVVSGYVTPAGRIIVPINVVPADYLNELKTYDLNKIPQIVAAVKLHGTTNGDVDVDSSEFAWPIRLSKVNPDRVGGLCNPNQTWCASGQGQDAFALACTTNSASP